VQSGWNIVSRVDTADGKIYRVAGNTNSGGAGDNGPATLAQLSSPQSVAFDSTGDMFIADSGNHAIRRVSAINGFITTFMNGFDGPYDLVFDSSGRLVVCDGDRIKRIDMLTLGVTTIVGGGSGYSGDGGPATAAGIGSANALVFDASGNFYFSDSAHHVVRRVSAAGIITTVAGTGSLGTSADGIPASSASLRWPSGVALASNGDLLMCDTNSHRIRRVDFSTGMITTLGGNTAYAGMAGVFGGDNGLAINADFNSPQGLTIGTDGHIYVCDIGNNRVRRIRQ
jgi:sugar lactone lactonase YvrE